MHAPGAPFYPEFAAPSDWAAMYRGLGLQVVPAHMPSEGASWKRPALADWKIFQQELAPDAVWSRWYGQGGEYTARPNMGVITGQASGGLICIDLDTYSNPDAALWWRGVLVVHNYGMEPETWQQTTGGGGRQLFFRTPLNWKAPTNRTAIGVDIRGQGGFAMLPPSHHSSGRQYEWAEGYEPWTIEIGDAPAWLLEEVTALVVRHGGTETAGPRQRTASPGTDFNAFGRRIDGREEYMTRLVWAVMVDWYRECPIPPSPAELDAKRLEAWGIYERSAKPRLGGAGTIIERLEREGRGPTLFGQKWARAFAKWDNEVAEDAKKEPPRARAKAEPPPKDPDPEPSQQSGQHPGPIKTVDFLTLLTEQVVEEPDYIEPAFLGPAGFALIAGPPKAQKSFLQQEVLVACATGGRFLCGAFQVPRPLRVFWLQAEMNRKLLRKRAREFSFLTGEERQLLAKNLIISERFHMILNDDGVKTAVETIKAVFPGEPPDILAFDPLANLFDAENENDNALLMRFLTGRIEAIRQKVNPLAAIFMVHHAAKRAAEDLARDPFLAIRGASALRGYYDSAIVIFRASEEGKARRLHFELRSGEAPEPMTLELVNGRFQEPSDTTTIDKPMARKILSAMDEAWRRGRPWSPHPQAKSEGRHFEREAVARFGVNAKELQKLLGEWMRNGVVTFRERVSRKHSAGFEITGLID